MTLQMTLHWAHVTAAYALVLLGFLWLAAEAALRHRAAHRRLAALERPRRGGQA
ncbi:MAG TPA: hypothetical protein VE684_21125 [Crenalkalicoccus sp.]|nr:hypothetical protein [Crenalkalicoccus sp.]